MRSRSAILLTAAIALAACGERPVKPVAGAPGLPDDAAYAVPEAPYDENADAQAQIDAVFAAAQASGKRVLVNLGGNWCSDCRILAGMMTIPDFAAFMDSHYEVAKIDVGDFDRNDSAVRRLRAADGAANLDGVPTVVIATPDGRVVNTGTSAEWITAESRQPQEAMNYFYRYAMQVPAADAERIDAGQAATGR